MARNATKASEVTSPRTDTDPLPSSDATEALWSRLHELQAEIGETKGAQSFLSAIWEYYIEKHEWPSTWTFNSRFGGRAEVRKLCEPLRGSVYESGHGGDHGQYALTLVGALLAGETLERQRFLVRYFEFARDRYRETPENRTIKHSEVEAAWRIAGVQTRILYRLLSLGGWQSGGSSPSGDSWELQIPSEVQDLPRHGKLDEEVEALTFRHFDQAEAVLIQDRERVSVDWGSQFEARPLVQNTPTIATGADVFSRRYQVFVSSTFEDLKAERQEVMQALLKTFCIPTGMELFPASNAQQWRVIERVIDECDYYIIIVAGRYGSIDAETAKSFTEREFDYAVKRGKPILAFYHRNIKKLRSEIVEETDEGRKNVKRFTEKVKRQRMCEAWETPAELGSAVKSAIINQLRDNQRAGWIRASAPVAQMSQIRSEKLDEIELLVQQGERTFPFNVEVFSDSDAPFIQNGKERRRLLFSHSLEISLNDALLALAGELGHETYSKFIELNRSDRFVHERMAPIVAKKEPKYAEWFRCVVRADDFSELFHLWHDQGIVRITGIEDSNVAAKLDRRGLKLISKLKASMHLKHR